MQNLQLGAVPTESGYRFRFWSTRATHADIVILDAQDQKLQTYPMTAREGGIFEAEITGINPGTRYKFRLDGIDLPDPYARYLPSGVHGPAELLADQYLWQTDNWQAPAAGELVIYELHVGTFTPEGTYAAAQQKLPYLSELGINAIELLPISSFPGARGWGYDGVAHFAPYAGYGTPDELRAFVDAAHAHGLAVMLDVVYNHWGPDGNYLAAYSPEYFTNAHATPWGNAPNFDQPHAGFMRAYVLENARYWLEEFRFDGLRLDATHTIQDDSAVHILQEIADMAARLPGGKFVIAEDERNWPGLLSEYGLDGVWADDFHHQVHVLLTSQQDGYYADYPLDIGTLARIIERGWLYEGQIAPHLGKPRGQPADILPASALVYCLQNHDQVGNRAFGERLNQLVDLENYLAASALLLFLPYTPLLFMGQEWAASTPFQYFTDHNPELGALVTAGRRREFEHFAAFADPTAAARIPDPQADATFRNSVLRWEERDQAPHARVLALYKQLLALRREDMVLRHNHRRQMAAGLIGNEALWVHRWQDGEHRLLLFNPGERTIDTTALLPLQKFWNLLLSTRPEDDIPGKFPDRLPAQGSLILSASDQ